MIDSYFVTAECAWEIAANGKPLDKHYLTVRVKDSGGEPVLNLKKSNFKVYDMGFGFGEVKISVVLEILAEGPSLPFLPGTYRIVIDRSQSMKGQFTYAVIVGTVKRGTRGKFVLAGQAFTSVVKIS